MTFNPDVFDDEEDVFVEMVMQIAEDGRSVSIMLMDVSIFDVDALLEELGTEKARDEILFRIAQALAHQAQQQQET